MHDLGQILENEILLVALLAGAIAQGVKMGLELVQNGELNLRYLLTTGGMPSSHSALVAALATNVGQVVGWGSAEFAIASLFAVIVMFDAAGVRQAAGKQARVLNQLIDHLFDEREPLGDPQLDELLGHTPLQVLVGFGLGIGVSLAAVPTL